MKNFFTLFIIVICSVLTAQAQTFTDHIQEKKSGLGTVTIEQSKAIDDLVNGKKTATTQTQQPPNRANAVQAQKHDYNPSSAGGKTAKTDASRTVRPEAAKAAQAKAQEEARQRELAAEKEREAERQTALAAEKKREAEAEAARKKEEAAKKADNDDGMNIPTVDMRKKVMRSSYKVTGYRVQAFAGGNTRADKMKAQQIGNNIKMKYPDVPVYVHFYSPRWICRVGNFRSYEQARWMLKAVKEMGYRSAIIVKGKITVQY